MNNDDTGTLNGFIGVKLDLACLRNLHHVASEGMAPRVGQGTAILVLLLHITAATSNGVRQIGLVVEQVLVVVGTRVATVVPGEYGLWRGGYRGGGGGVRVSADVVYRRSHAHPGRAIGDVVSLSVRKFWALETLILMARRRSTLSKEYGNGMVAQ